MPGSPYKYKMLLMFKSHASRVGETSAETRRLTPMQHPNMQHTALLQPYMYFTLSTCYYTLTMIVREYLTCMLSAPAYDSAQSEVARVIEKHYYFSTIFINPMCTVFISNILMFVHLHICVCRHTCPLLASVESYCK